MTDFFVVAWVKKTEAELKAHELRFGRRYVDWKVMRARLPGLIIEATDGITAAKEYAEDNHFQLQDWFNAGPSPRVVIRTEDMSEES